MNKFVYAQANYTDSGGFNEIVKTQVYKVQNVNDPAQGTVTLSTTTPKVGQTVTATGVETITDPDGLSSSQSWGYRWYRDDAVISGATASSYTVIADDVGKKLQAEVVFTDALSGSESIKSVQSSAVGQNAQGVLALAATSGSVQQNQTLVVGVTSLTDLDGVQASGVKF